MVLLRFLIIVVGNAFTVLNHYLGAKIEQNMVLDLRSDLFAHVQRLSLTFHDQRQTGALMSQINIQARPSATSSWSSRRSSRRSDADRDAGHRAADRLAAGARSR